MEIDLTFPIETNLGYRMIGKFLRVEVVRINVYKEAGAELFGLEIVKYKFFWIIGKITHLRQNSCRLKYSSYLLHFSGYLY